MAIHIVMDRTGDSRHPFNSHDAQELAKAEQRFLHRILDPRTGKTLRMFECRCGAMSWTEERA